MRILTQIILLFSVTVLFAPASNAQDYREDLQSEKALEAQIGTHCPLYNQAYQEIADMLDGKIDLSIKRAIFLTEWAYLDGELNYDDFCHGIDTVATFLRNFIEVNGLQQYKTAGNYALFEYFCRSYSGNGYQPFTYDYEDFSGSADLTKLFVSKVMRTHSGQCRGLPMYYKVLAEAIGAEAHITFAPQHLFIRHRDEMEPNKWVNVELTTQSLSREIFYIERFNIGDQAIRNKVYLYPLTDKETVAYLLSEMLLTGYLRKYNDYDDLVWSSVIKSLEHYPQNINALQNKANRVNNLLMKYLATNNHQIDEYAKVLDAQWHIISDEIKALGWSEMDYKLYEKLLRETEEQKRKEQVGESATNTEIETIK